MKTYGMIDLPTAGQMESAGKALGEFREIVESVARTILSIDQSKLGIGDRALLLTLRKNAERFLWKYWDNKVT